MVRFGGTPPKKMCRQKQQRTETHYSVLAVPPSSTQAELRRKFLELAEIYHPDKAPRKQREEHDKYCQTETHHHCPVCQLRGKFTAITFAYAILKDEKSRAKYDKELKIRGGQCKTCAGAGTLRQGFKSDKKKICPMCQGTGQSMTEVI